MTFAKKYGAEILDEDPDSCTLQLMGRISEIDEFVTMPLVSESCRPLPAAAASPYRKVKLRCPRSIEITGYRAEQ